MVRLLYEVEEKRPFTIACDNIEWKIITHEPLEKATMNEIITIIIFLVIIIIIPEEFYIVLVVIEDSPSGDEYSSTWSVGKRLFTRWGNDRHPECTVNQPSEKNWWFWIFFTYSLFEERSEVTKFSLI